MTRALEGIKVVELSRFIAAPYCGSLLADLGAEVTKVEAPSGDPSRNEGPWHNGESLFFSQMNRNKNSVTLDLKSEDGKDALWNLIKSCDILIENFRPGVLERMGFNTDEILKVNERLVILRMPGFGSSSDMGNRAAFDCILQSVSGLATISGSSDSDKPMLLGTYPVDSTAAVLGSTAVLAALNQRHNTGRGQVVEVSLLDAAMALLGPYAAGGATGQNPEKVENADRELAPANTYSAKDGWVYIHAGLDHFWKKLAEIADLTWALTDSRFNTDNARRENRDIIDEMIGKWVSNYNVEEIEKMLEAENIPVSRVNTVAEAFKDERLGLQKRVQSVKGANGEMVPVLQSPLFLSDSPIDISKGAPKLED